MSIILNLIGHFSCEIMLDVIPYVFLNYVFQYHYSPTNVEYFVIHITMLGGLIYSVYRITLSSWIKHTDQKFADNKLREFRNIKRAKNSFY